MDIIQLIQDLNKSLPLEYLRRNHIQYEFVVYISLVETLFISKNFTSSGAFVNRAYSFLDSIENNLLDKEYLNQSKSFLRIINQYLLENCVIESEHILSELKKNLELNKNSDQ